MKKTNFFHSMTLMGMLTAIICMMTACGNEEEDPITPPAQDTTGEVAFSIDVTNGGTGAGTNNSPATVEQGDTLNMTISQKSTYKDSDGSVHTFEPKATIALHTSADTLYTKDLKELTTVSEPSTKTTSTGTDPVTHSTVQTFCIGGKDVTFNLAYEIFSYLNSEGKKKEMPYVKLNNAQYGKASSSEASTRAGQKATASVAGMSIRPHNATRGIVVTENTAYDVNVKFNLDVESVNTSSTQKQNLAFEVNFLAIVESSRELSDPTMDYSYKLNILGGTNSSQSPFAVLPNKTLSLEWAQSATYTYFSEKTFESNVVSCAPKATAKVYADADTLWLSDVSEIKKVSEQPANTSTSGTYPKVTATKQIFKVGEQSITTECTYEQFTGYKEDSISLNMPYLKLGAVSVSNVDVQEHKNVTISGKKANIFNVTVRLSQAVTGENTPSNISETVQYVVKYVVVQLIEEPKLVDVRYRKDFIIEEPHHNMPLATRYVVYRDRIYSNGETVTDTFTSGLCAAVEGSSNIDSKPTPLIYDDGMQIIKADTVAVTNPEATEFYDLRESESEDFPFGEKLETYELMGAGEYFNPESPKEGWYFRDVSKIYQRGAKNPEIYHRNLRSMMSFYDRFLYIDGQIINFWDKVMTHNVEYSSESKTLEDGTPAKVFTLKHTAKYLGMDFSHTLHDVYVQKK